MSTPAITTEVSATVERRFFTVDGGASYTSLSVESIRRMIACGKLTAYRPVKRRILIDRHQLDAVVLSSDSRPRTGRGLAGMKRAASGKIVPPEIQTAAAME